MASFFRVSTVVLVLGSILAASPSLAQFGQNKIAYEQFDWKVYESPHFDIHYYEAQEEFLQEIVSYAESAYLQISKDLDHELRFRVPLIVYKTHQEFRQTNITLSELPEAVLAFAEPIQHRMVLPIDLPPDELYELIAHELTHIFQYSIFFEGSLGRAIRSNPPRWLFEGMASYLAKDESNIDRMAIRDAVVNNFLPPIQALDYFSFLTYRYGHALFDFIEQEHGKEGFRNFIYSYRQVLLANNLEKAVKDTFGYDIDEFNRRFNRYLRKKYFPVLLEKKHPDDYGTEIGARKRPERQGKPTFSPALSPSGELIAALSLTRMELDLVVLSAEDGRLVRNLTAGWTNDYQNLVTEAFSGKRDIAWSPTGDQVAVFVRKENRRPLFVFDALTGKRVRTIDLDDIYEAAAPAFSPDGTRIAFEGNLRGTVDLFEYDLASGEVRNLTQDSFFDSNPWYSADGETLLYNRRIGEHWKVFQVDLDDPTRKTQITFGTYSDLQPSYSRDGQWIYFASDRDPYGVFNIYALDMQTGNVRQYTDVVGGCFAPVEMVDERDERTLVFASYYAGQFRLYRMPLLEVEREIPIEELAAAPVEAEPFQAPLSLSLDEDAKRPYKLLWDIESPSISVGVTDDGTLLSTGRVTFSDLLGDQRINVYTLTYDTFSNTMVEYVNLKRRWNWGARLYDFRDYYLTVATRDQVQRSTGANVFYQYPLSRHYRFEAGVGFLDRSQDFFRGVDPNTGAALFDRFKEQYATAQVSLIGDTTRFQRFGPFQGKRFNVSAFYGARTGGDAEGDLLDYTLDFRTYKQATRRSTLAWRLFGLWSDGDRQSLYGVGGINVLRGYDFREFFGSRILVSNLEFRFPLVDALQTPIGTLGPVRGFFFFDLGAAWLQDDLFYDPDLRQFRGRFSGQDLPFEFWDSENDRLQDGRGSYGFGFQMFFAGLQLNWSWAERLPYTQYVLSDPTNPFSQLVPVENDGGERRFDFYIIYDF